jgi:hypothetical protein
MWSFTFMTSDIFKYSAIRAEQVNEWQSHEQRVGGLDRMGPAAAAHVIGAKTQTSQIGTNICHVNETRKRKRVIGMFSVIFSWRSQEYINQ